MTNTFKITAAFASLILVVSIQANAHAVVDINQVKFCPIQQVEECEAGFDVTQYAFPSFENTFDIIRPNLNNQLNSETTLPGFGFSPYRSTTEMKA